MDETRKFAYKEMLLIEINARYFECVASRCYRYDLWSKIFLAVFSSSGAVAGWAIWKANDIQWLAYAWTFLSSTAAVLAVALPILNFTKKLEFATRLKVEYTDLSHDYNMLWLRVDESEKNEIEKELEKLRAKEKKFAALENHFPIIDRMLFDKCQKEVVQCHSNKTKG